MDIIRLTSITASEAEPELGFFEEFVSDIVSIGSEFADKFKNIPHRGSVVLENLPIALTGFVVVLSMLAIIAIVILVFSKVMATLEKGKSKKTATAPAAAAPAPAPAAQGNPLPETQSAGKLDLVDVDEPTAAVIMALVSDKSGIPLNRLSFKSIKRVEDK